MLPADVNVLAVAAADSRRSNSPESGADERRPQKKRAKQSSSVKYSQKFLKLHAPAAGVIADKARDRIRHLMLTDKTYAYPESPSVSYALAEALYAEAVRNFSNFKAESRSIIDKREIDETLIITYVRLSLRHPYLHCTYWIR
jgi:hypothetical protein